jgi:hypothetical protein
MAGHAAHRAGRAAVAVRVEYHPADDGGCGLYRLTWAAEALAQAGMDVCRGREFMAVHQAGPDGPSDDDPMIGLEPVDADVVVLQRVLNRDVCDAIPYLQAQGCAVVVEIDDDFHALPKSNPAHDQTDPRLHPRYNRDVLMEACRRADLVTCSTEPLLRRYGHGHGVVIPNYVRARWLDLEPKPAEAPPVVGWTGVVTTHDGDLEAMGRPMPLPRGWSFRNIGSVRSRQVLGLPDGRFESRPWLDLTTDDYPVGIGKFTVGVVPLAATHFNRSKSWLKGIEYAAAGVPFVASRVTSYRDLERAGIGVCAGTPAEWVAQVHLLASSAQLRADRAGAARERVAAMTIEGNVHRWWEAWQQALTNRRCA